MPFLSVGGQTVAASLDGPRKQRIAVGGQNRAFDGTLRSTVRATKREWDIATIPQARATADTMETALTSTTASVPFTTFGDLINVASSASINCHIAEWESESVGTPSGELVISRFRLLEQ